jgi:hypothetical protein
VGFYEAFGREGILDLMTEEVFQMLLNVFTVSIILIIVVPRHWAYTIDNNLLKVIHSVIILLFSCFPENK